MMLMKNFTAAVKDLDGISIMLFTDENGSDWYEAQKDFSKTSLKFMFDERGNIVAASFDASMLAPEGLSVSEVSKSSVPKTFFETGTRWVFDGKKIIPFSYTTEELLQHVEEQRAALLSEAKENIIVDQTRLTLGRALTDEQTRKLHAWLDYIDALEALDLTELPVNWPPAPEEK